MKPIPGLERYLVTENGAVYSEISKRFLQPRLDPGGYWAVRLMKKRAKVGRAYRIHELVLLAYVGPRPAKNDCRHLNGCRTDNSLTNLAYGTRAQNAADSIAHGTKRSGFAKLTRAQVEAIRESFRRRPQWSRLAWAMSIAADFGVHHSTIIRAATGQTGSAANP